MRWLIPAGLGLLVGLAIGASAGYAESAPGGGLFPKAFGQMVAGVAAIGGAGILGLILLVPERTRRAGGGLLVGAVGVALGWPLGMQVPGPRWQPPREVTGEVIFELRSPTTGHLAGLATCTTEANGSRISMVDAPAIGSVGIDTLGLRLQLGDSSVAELLVNEHNGYEGTLAVDEATADWHAGAATFVSQQAGIYRLAGAPPDAAVTGSITWRCGPATPGASVPTVAPEVVRLQGWFELHGLVEMPDPCPGDGPCAPYGLAAGICSADADLGTESIETKVPWLDGHEARLSLVPGRESATLSLQPDDGSPPETVSAPAQLERVELGGGETGLFQLRADFVLGAGVLSLFVEWDCIG